MIRAAAYCATGLGAFALFACIVAFPMIMQEISEIRTQLNTEMEAWKVELRLIIHL